MSIILQEDELKGLPDDYLAREMENPSGQYPQFLVFTELNRRKDLRERFAEQQAQAPTSTMAEEMVAEFSGIGQAMPPQMMPPMDMPMQGMPMQMMSGGGVVGFKNGALVPSEEEINALMNRLGVDRNRAIQIFQYQNTPSNPSLGGESIPSSPPRPRSGLVIDRRVTEESSNADGSAPSPLRGYFGAGIDTLKYLYENTPYSPGYTPPPVEPESAVVEKTQSTENASVTGPGTGVLPFDNQQSTPTFKERIDEVMSAFGPAPEPEYSDLDRFEAMFEELNPAPDPNVTRGRALMAIGQRLLGAPTFAEGLSAGAGGVGKIYGEDAAAQREYNKNRLAAKQALMKTRDARAEFAANRDFQGRTSAVRAAAQMYGDDVTAARYARSDQASLMQDELETLIERVEFLKGDEEKAALERIQFLRNRLNSMFGPRVTRDLVVTPTP